MSDKDVREGIVRLIHDFDFRKFGMENVDPATPEAAWVPALADEIVKNLGVRSND